jgi:hypothetical protein
MAQIVVVTLSREERERTCVSHIFKRPATAARHMFIANATGQGGNPARDASRFAEGFPLMISPQSRAPLRIIKSSKLKRQPKIKSAKAAKNNYSHFAVAAVLSVAVALLASSLSHLAVGIAST